MTAYFLPIIIGALLIYSAVKGVGVYDCFVDGAKEALKMIGTIFPYICAIFICIQLFKESGLAALLVKFLDKPLGLLGIPKEVAELILLRPVSGAGSLAIFEGILDEYGADSYVSKCAAVIMGSTETILYIASIYFSGCKVKKLRGAVPIALAAAFIGSIVACLLCRFI